MRNMTATTVGPPADTYTDIPEREGEYGDRCLWCDEPATTVAVFARSY